MEGRHASWDRGTEHFTLSHMHSKVQVVWKRPYTCEENSWRLGECPTRPNTGGKLVVIRSAEGWARTQKPWLQTSYHLPHLTTPG